MCRFLKGIGLSAFVHCGKFFANVARFSLLSIYVQIIFLITVYLRSVRPNLVKTDVNKWVSSGSDIDRYGCRCCLSLKGVPLC